jgi:hypothetical protein
MHPPPSHYHYITKSKDLFAKKIELGTVKNFDYAFSLAVLKKIEVTPQGKLTFCLLCGVRLTM